MSESPTAKELYESGSGGPIRHADRATFSAAVEAFVIACRSLTDAERRSTPNNTTMAEAKDILLAAMKSAIHARVVLPWDNQEDSDA